MGRFSVREMMVEPIEHREEPVVPAEQLRTIDDITAEINFYKRQTAQNIIEIGRRLIEAKDELAHGEWLPWLRDRVELTASTAQRFMQIAREFSNTAPVRYLNYSQVLALLQVPAEEREEFIAESHLVDGQEKTVAEMSKRELEQTIKERDDARRDADAAKKKAKAFEQQSKKEYDNYMDALVRIERMEESRRAFEGDRQARIRELEQRLKELEARPVDVAVQEVSPEEIDRMRREIRAELEAAQGEAVGLPPDMLEQAEERFCLAMDNAYSSFYMVAQISDPASIPVHVQGGIDACKMVMDDLFALKCRAENLLYSGGCSLPPEDDDDD